MFDNFTPVEDDPEFGSQQTPDGRALISCGVCEMKRPVTASHCYDCGVCVDELDHHCPWTGECCECVYVCVFL